MVPDDKRLGDKFITKYLERIKKFFEFILQIQLLNKQVTMVYVLNTFAIQMSGLKLSNILYI